MKTTKLKNWLAVGAAILTVSMAIRASADQPSASATAAHPDKHYSGTIASVDRSEHTLTVKGWFLFKKTFNLGDNCAYQLWEKPDATAAGLHPGEKVTVSYQDVQGVLIADRVHQHPMHYEGAIKSIDPDHHSLTLRLSAWDKQMQIAGNCKVVLRGDKPGTLADLHPGDHVTVTYDKPGDKPTARQIAQTSLKFTGTLTAIDLGERTLKAKSLFDSKKFNVADDCAIVINGKINGRLSDLRPDTSVMFSYDDINGVNVANRIAPETPAAEPQTNSVASAAAP